MVVIVILIMNVKFYKVENLFIIVLKYGLFMFNKLDILYIIVVCNKLLWSKEIFKTVNRLFLRVD